MSSGCNCGSNCSCGSDCKCGKMYPDLETTSTGSIIGGVASVNMYSEGSEMGYGAENDCKCGASCSCTSCGCHK